MDIQAGRVARKIKAFNASNRTGLYDVDPADYVYIQTLYKSATGADVDKKYVQLGVCGGQLVPEVNITAEVEEPA